MIQINTFVTNYRSVKTVLKLMENDTPDTTFSVIEKRKQKCSTEFFYGTGILLCIGRTRSKKPKC